MKLEQFESRVLLNASAEEADDNLNHEGNVGDHAAAVLIASEVKLSDELLRQDENGTNCNNASSGLSIVDLVMMTPLNLLVGFGGALGMAHLHPVGKILIGALREGNFKTTFKLHQDAFVGAGALLFAASFSMTLISNYLSFDDVESTLKSLAIIGTASFGCIAGSILYIVVLEKELFKTVGAVPSVSSP